VSEPENRPFLEPGTRSEKGGDIYAVAPKVHLAMIRRTQMAGPRVADGRVGTMPGA